MEGFKTDLTANKVGSISQSQDATILIVDDAAVNRELLRLTLSRYGYKFLSAANGYEATKLLDGNPDIDLIILDLMMPVMDGFDFLKWRSTNIIAQKVPVIVNSSLDDFDSIAQALQMEAYDYFTKPLSKEILNVILPLKIKNAIVNRRLMSQTQHQYEIMRLELEMASRYQKFLLPTEPQLENVQVAFRFQPCSAVGGDYFDFVELPQGKMACAVADVSGHGVASAMTASICKALLPRYLRRYHSPAKALNSLNNDLVSLTQQDVFVTAFAIIYDPKARVLTWATAGHPPPLFLSPQNGCSHLIRESTFLGIFDSGDPMVHFEDVTVDTKPGDRIALYTDGLTEAPDQKGRRYGLARLENLLLKQQGSSIDSMLESLWRDLELFVNSDFPDDVAIIFLEF
jgi:sigma-B regulation protein RsbU (phosphoserine phosphatase)